MSDTTGVDPLALSLTRMLVMDHAAEHAATREMMRQLDARFQRTLDEMKAVIADLKAEATAERANGAAAFIGRLQTQIVNAQAIRNGDPRRDPDAGLAIPQVPGGSQ